MLKDSEVYTILAAQRMLNAGEIQNLISTGTVDNAHKLGTIPAANYVTTSALTTALSGLSSGSGGGLTEAQVDARVDAKAPALSVDNAAKLGGVAAANYALNSQLTGLATTASLSGYATTGALTSGLSPKQDATQVQSAITTALTAYTPTANLPAAGLDQTAVDARVNTLASGLSVNNSARLNNQLPAFYATKTEVDSKIGTADCDTRITTLVPTLTALNSTKLNNVVAADYALKTDLSSYATTTALTEGLLPKQTSAQVQTAIDTALAGLPANGLSQNQVDDRVTTLAPTLSVDNAAKLGTVAASNYALKSELTGLATTASLSGYATTGALTSGLSPKQDATQVQSAITTALTDYTPTADLPAAGLDQTAVDARIDTKATTLTVDNATKLGTVAAADYALKTDLTPLATTASLSGYATTGALTSGLGPKQDATQVQSAITTALTAYTPTASLPAAGLDQTAVDARVTTLVPTLTALNSTTLNGASPNTYLFSQVDPVGRTSSFVLAGTDVNKLITFSFATNTDTITLPATTWTIGQEVELVNTHATTAIAVVAGGNTLRVQDPSKTKIKPNHAIAVIKCIAVNTYLLVGQLQS